MADRRLPPAQWTNVYALCGLTDPNAEVMRGAITPVQLSQLTEHCVLSHRTDALGRARPCCLLLQSFVRPLQATDGIDRSHAIFGSRIDAPENVGFWR